MEFLRILGNRITVFNFNKEVHKYMISKTTPAELERKKHIVETLYHHSGLSVESIADQVDMSIMQVQDIIDSIKKYDTIIVDQDKTSVEKIMTNDVSILEHTKTVYDAAVLMSKKDIGCVVVTAGGKPYGIITERDIVRGIPGMNISLKNITLDEFASRPIIVVEPTQTVGKVADMMIRQKIHRMPVVQNGKIIGIITVTDLAKFLSPVRRMGLVDSILSVIAREER